MESTFFSGKRPWSKIKDQILSQYMPAYLSKVAKLGKPIILIDAFAGPAKFDDGSAGSPLIICHAAEKHVKGRYQAIFVNSQQDHHDKLSYVLSSFIEQNKVVALHGTADELLTKVRDVLDDHTVFLYLDPFGLKGCEFSIIEPFLQRNRTYSTEIVVNLNIPTMHRLASRHAVSAGRSEVAQIRAFHNQLTMVLGGNYWKDVLLADSIEPEKKADLVMAMYRDKILSIREPRAYSGSCPVREKVHSSIKYYVTFFSRHQDAMLLMNDAMCTAYHQRMYESWTEGTLFEDSNWQDIRDLQKLEEIVINSVSEASRKKSRLELWVDIVQKNFMQFTSSEYRKAIRKLVKENNLAFDDVRGTGKLNNDIRLYIP
ncbi:MAG: three-Cys-motif partner protein TcmP [Gemmatimonadetes bacterium]|nr:three-Cys-motif partner protein TcmP [Gemmatimonadota bacterium]MYG14836.1 three-Cys-motif partner protein TcmP [Gemmatimonadota bacterium]